MTKKSIAHEKLEQAIGIGQAISKLDLSKKPSHTDDDDESKKVRAIERMRIAQQAKEEFEELKNGEDSKYLEDKAKELLETMMSAVRVAYDEYANTGDYKILEGIASLNSSIVATMREIRDAVNDAKKLDQQQQIIDMKRNAIASKNSNGLPMGSHNTVVITTADLLKQLRQEEKQATIDVKKEEN